MFIDSKPKRKSAGFIRTNSHKALPTFKGATKGDTSDQFSSFENQTKYREQSDGEFSPYRHKPTKYIRPPLPPYKNFNSQGQSQKQKIKKPSEKQIGSVYSSEKFNSEYDSAFVASGIQNQKSISRQQQIKKILRKRAKVEDQLSKISKICSQIDEIPNQYQQIIVQNSKTGKRRIKTQNSHFQLQNSKMEDTNYRYQQQLQQSQQPQQNQYSFQQQYIVPPKNGRKQNAMELMKSYNENNRHKNIVTNSQNNKNHNHIINKNINKICNNEKNGKSISNSSIRQLEAQNKNSLNYYLSDHHNSNNNDGSNMVTFNKNLKSVGNIATRTDYNQRQNKTVTELDKNTEKQGLQYQFSESSVSQGEGENQSFGYFQNDMLTHHPNFRQLNQNNADQQDSQDQLKIQHERALRNFIGDKNHSSQILSNHPEQHKQQQQFQQQQEQQQQQQLVQQYDGNQFKQTIKQCIQQSSPSRMSRQLMPRYNNSSSSNNMNMNRMKSGTCKQEQPGFYKTRGGICFDLDVNEFTQNELPIKPVNSRPMLGRKPKKVDTKQQILKRRQMARNYDKQARMRVFGAY